MPSLAWVLVMVRSMHLPLGEITKGKYAWYGTEFGFRRTAKRAYRERMAYLNTTVSRDHNEQRLFGNA